MADKTGRKPEDLRVLARVYEAQKTVAGHKKAREVLEELVATNSAGAEDQFLLAEMYSNDGDWAKAHEQYRALLAQTENTKDLEILIRRPDYITQFIADLLKHYKSDQEQQELAKRKN